jgi:hypothetical protein
MPPAPPLGAPLTPGPVEYGIVPGACAGFEPVVVIVPVLPPVM